MPWSNDDGYAWNATRCAPIDDDPKAPGETCTVVDSSVSGIDDCEKGAMCWDVDPKTNVGECVGMCQGTAMNPLCTNPCDACRIMNEGVLTLCLASCDPLVNECAWDQVCYPLGAGFACFPDVQADIDLGDPCNFAQDCDPGNFCAPVDDVPNCAQATSAAALASATSRHRTSAIRSCLAPPASHGSTPAGVPRGSRGELRRDHGDRRVRHRSLENAERRAPIAHRRGERIFWRHGEFNDSDVLHGRMLDFPARDSGITTFRW